MASVEQAEQLTIESPLLRWSPLSVKIGLFLGWAVLFGSVLIRLINITDPVVDRHEFRQTQTAITVWTFVNEGIRWVKYETPILGPPFRAPMEFPTYQAVAAVLVKLTGISVDLSCRLTCLGFFIGCGVFLYLTVRHFALARGPALCCLLALFVSPFTIAWSRTAMIEFAASFFALGFGYAVIKWLSSPRNIFFLLLALTFGVLATTTKVTTFITVVPFLVYFVIHDILKPTGLIRNVVGGERYIRIACLALVVVLPLVAGVWWVHVSDKIKDKSPNTAWLSSSKMSDWNFGTLAQRQSLDSWSLIGHRIAEMVLPYGMLLLPVIGLCGAHLIGGRAKALGWVSVACVFSGPLAFFNLYKVHDYYLSAIVCPLAILTGFGLYVLVAKICVRSYLGVGIVTLVLIGSLSLGWSYLDPTFRDNTQHFSITVGKLVADATPPEKYVLITDHDWIPDILYYSHRKGLMLKKDIPGDFRSTPLDNFTTVVTRSHDHPVLKWWANRQFITTSYGFHIYHVSNPQPH